MSPSKQLVEELQNKYLEAQLRGDSAAGTKVIETALNKGWNLKKIYLELFTPNQVELGEMWHRGEINVAEEHLGTQMTMDHMSKLVQLFRPKNQLPYRVVVTTFSGEFHFMGARMLSDLLSLEGWQVDFLGPNTPAEDLVEFAGNREVDLVAISITREENIGEMQQVVNGLRKEEKPPKILLGGNLTDSILDEAQNLNIDATATNLLDGMDEIYKLFDMEQSNSLDDYLQNLGQVIQNKRKRWKWSQKELAEKAGLDRTYISAVEHGKQNVTLSVLIKLSQALDIPLPDLFQPQKL